mgnify:CR=1 FL=1|jgi:hypothetical protein
MNLAIIVVLANLDKNVHYGSPTTNRRELVMTRLAQFIAAAILVLAISVRASPVFAQSDLEGAWEVTSAVSGDFESTQAGLYIFHGEYYSVLHVWSDEARPLYGEEDDRSTVDHETLLNVVGPVEGNSGRFEVDGSTLTTRPSVAISPNYMRGGSNSYEFSISGDVLTLRNETRELTLTRVH